MRSMTARFPSRAGVATCSIRHRSNRLRGRLVVLGLRHTSSMSCASCRALVISPSFSGAMFLLADSAVWGTVQLCGSDAARKYTRACENRQRRGKDDWIYRLEFGLSPRLAAKSLRSVDSVGLTPASAQAHARCCLSIRSTSSGNDGALSGRCRATGNFPGQATGA